MAVAFGDFGACRTYHLAQPQRRAQRRRNGCTVRRGVTVDSDDVGLLDAVARRQGGDEALRQASAASGRSGSSTGMSSSSLSFMTASQL
jgi:hypothetical protein